MKLLVGFLVSAILVSLNPIGIEAINFTELAINDSINFTELAINDSMAELRVAENGTTPESESPTVGILRDIFNVSAKLNTTEINETESAIREADRIIREAVNKGAINGTSQGGGAVQILSHNSYTDSVGYFHVVGEVENNTPTTAEYVQVTGTFYDINDAVVGTQFTYTNPPDISSGGKAPFDLALTTASVPSSMIDHYNLVASYQ
jgi:hypothetical protein